MIARYVFAVIVCPSDRSVCPSVTSRCSTN